MQWHVDGRTTAGSPLLRSISAIVMTYSTAFVLAAQAAKDFRQEEWKPRSVLPSFSKGCLLVQIVSSRAFAVAREAQIGSCREEWKMCVPLVDMLDHGGPCMYPKSCEPVRQDNVRSASDAACVLCHMLCKHSLGHIYLEL